MKLVYIASPLRGDYKENIFKAVLYCKWAISMKVIPLAPHIIFTQFLDDKDEIQREYAITLSLDLLSKCDEVWFMGSIITEGMMRELKQALKLHKKIKFINDSQIKNGGVYENIDC